MSPEHVIQVLLIGAGVLGLLAAAVNAAGQRALFALLAAAFITTGVWLVPLMAS